MSSFAKLVAVLSAALLCGGVFAQKPADDKTKPAADASGAGDKKKKDRGKKAKPADSDGQPKAIDVPVPQGHDAKGLKIPYRDGDGKLQMIFTIGVASRIDDNHIKMSDLQIETFDEEEKHEMTIDLPTSIMDLQTSVISTQMHVTIKRSDFELTGETMIFNTKTRQGGLGGKVRMLIYDLADETGDTPQAPEVTLTPDTQPK